MSEARQVRSAGPSGIPREDKRHFVEGPLKECLAWADVSVEDLTLSADGAYVMIHYINGGMKTVNVAGDSRLAIMRDVVEASL